MKELSTKFFNAYFDAFSNRTVFTDDVPKEMMLTEEDEEGWFGWKLIKGTLNEDDYQKVEKEFNVNFPKSFVEWHKEYYFLDADTSIIRLPTSNPNLPLEELRDDLNWFIAEQLIPQKLYPFGDEGNDAGPLVFDGRADKKDNEFPIRIYDHEFGGDLEGLSEIIFSSFEKLLECLTHYMTELKTRKNFEIIPDFFKIDPTGAGSTGIGYWQGWANMQKANFEEFGH
jgi:hypothetical protein